MRAEDVEVDDLAPVRPDAAVLDRGDRAERRVGGRHVEVPPGRLAVVVDRASPGGPTRVRDACLVLERDPRVVPAANLPDEPADCRRGSKCHLERAVVIRRSKLTKRCVAQQLQRLSRFRWILIAAPRHNRALSHAEEKWR